MKQDQLLEELKERLEAIASTTEDSAEDELDRTAAIELACMAEDAESISDIIEGLRELRWTPKMAIQLILNCIISDGPVAMVRGVEKKWHQL